MSKPWQPRLQDRGVCSAPAHRVVSNLLPNPQVFEVYPVFGIDTAVGTSRSGRLGAVSSALPIGIITNAEPLPSHHTIAWPPFNVEMPEAKPMSLVVSLRFPAFEVLAFGNFVTIGPGPSSGRANQRGRWVKAAGRGGTGSDGTAMILGWM
ncbi:hypothetical protein PM082_023254 [Marasmius tenuissimus]|nr:hypothetical protein PM082_023254 [Marasmius tenuissimus]